MDDAESAFELDHAYDELDIPLRNDFVRILLLNYPNHIWMCLGRAVCVSHGAQDLDIVRMVAYGNGFTESVLRNILFGCLLGNLQESIELGKALGREIHCGRA